MGTAPYITTQQIEKAMKKLANTVKEIS
jgi:hypothetical protein